MVFWRKKEKSIWTGLPQAGGIALYILGVAGFMYFAPKMFGRVDNFFAPVLFLSMFVVSAMICSLLMFYQPYQLFLDKMGKEAIAQVLMTTKWLAVFLVLVLFALVLL